MALCALVLVLAIAPARAAQPQVLPELQAAQEAVQRATDADADQYAPDLLQTARNELAAAQAALANRGQRKQAPWLAQRARADADLARARSGQAQAQARLAQAQQDVAQLRKSLGLPAEGTP
ncbi:MAG: DUF4398 domain-containing protein [Pseudoxanthomonas sp.]